jgi:hypothetical protein
LTYTPRRCARCGNTVPSLLDLAGVAQRADKALRTMRLALPDDVTKGVRACASGLACYSQTCTPAVPKDAA